MTVLSPSAPPRTADRLLPLSGDSSRRAHLALHGPLPRIRRRDPRLLAEVEASGLTGRGGAAFPTATKLAAVSARRSTAVIANGTEGEPTSWKDEALLSLNPHLVLDGLVIAARLIGARQATIAVAEGSRAASAIARAIDERASSERTQMCLVADRFISGEESALTSAVNRGKGLPTGRRPFEQGVLVQNVETLANLALIARYGADWFRDAGTDAEPGTALATVSGAVAMPGVVEFEPGTTLGDLFDMCGGIVEPVDAVLVGGYFGTWMRADPQMELTNATLRRYGGSLGARVFVAFPRSACGLTEVARVTRYLAGESAGQCGPCVFGLPALADALDAVVDGRHSEAGQRRLEQLRSQIARRGACHHPDGTLAFVSSALTLFAHEIDNHRRGVCTGTSHTPILPTPRPLGRR